MLPSISKNVVYILKRMNVYESHKETIMSVNISVEKNDLSSELTCILLERSPERQEQPLRENDS